MRAETALKQSFAPSVFAAVAANRAREREREREGTLEQAFSRSTDLCSVPEILGSEFRAIVLLSKTLGCLGPIWLPT